MYHMRMRVHHSFPDRIVIVEYAIKDNKRGFQSLKIRSHGFTGQKYQLLDRSGPFLNTTDAGKEKGR